MGATFYDYIIADKTVVPDQRKIILQKKLFIKKIVINLILIQEQFQIKHLKRKTLIFLKINLYTVILIQTTNYP